MYLSQQKRSFASNYFCFFEKVLFQFKNLL